MDDGVMWRSEVAKPLLLQESAVSRETADSTYFRGRDVRGGSPMWCIDFTAEPLRGGCATQPPLVASNLSSHLQREPNGDDVLRI
jgi:hypothetical protein